MFTITPAAAKQIMFSIEQSGTEPMPLRIAAEKTADNTLHYGMGFDEKKEDDTSLTSEGIDVIISPLSMDLLKDAKLDYVELQPGKFEFIFLNPNDPEYKPPQES